jgi:hypothetical protein
MTEARKAHADAGLTVARQSVLSLTLSVGQPPQLPGSLRLRTESAGQEKATRPPSYRDTPLLHSMPDPEQLASRATERHRRRGRPTTFPKPAPSRSKPELGKHGKRKELLNASAS